MTLPRDLTTRELAAAAGCGRRWHVKKIAAEMGVSDKRVYALITAIAVKIGVPEGCDDRLCVGDWWLANVPIRLDGDAA